MDTSRLPEPLRRRIKELDALPPIEVVRLFLSGSVADAAGLDEVRADLERLAATNVRGLHRKLGAVESLLAQPPAKEGALASLVEWDGNWVLEDPSDRGAAAFLGVLAELLRSVIAEAEAGHSP